MKWLNYKTMVFFILKFSIKTYSSMKSPLFIHIWKKKIWRPIQKLWVKFWNNFRTSKTVRCVVSHLEWKVQQSSRAHLFKKLWSLKDKTGICRQLNLYYVWSCGVRSQRHNTFAASLKCSVVNETDKLLVPFLISP